MAGHLLRALLLSVGLFGATAGPADEIDVGRTLVEEHCSGCHAVTAEGESPLADAPPFRELHLRYDVGFLVEALVEGIVTAHPEMPQFEFEPTQAEAIVSYLRTLEQAAN